MELFLNLFWAFVAVVAAFAIARSTSGQSKRRRYLGAVATICVLALLFPIISVTDDLHDDVAVLEETNAVRRSASVVAHVDAFVQMLMVLPLAFAPVWKLEFCGRIATVEPFVRFLDAVRLVVAVRPPPALLA